MDSLTEVRLRVRSMGCEAASVETLDLLEDSEDPEDRRRLNRDLKEAIV